MFRVVDQNLKVYKYAGRSKAIVIDNADPLKQGRIRVDHPIIGETDWIPYLQIPGMYFLPEIEDLVYIESDCGFYDYPIAWGNLPKRESENGALVEVPEVFQRTYPSNRGIYSTDGHLVELDDGEDLVETSKGIRITSSDDSKIHITEEPTSKTILIERSEGSKIELDGLLDTITISTNGGDSIVLSPSGGIECSNAAGDLVTLTNGTITVTNVAGDSIELSSGSVSVVNVAGDSIELSSGNIDVVNAGGAAINMSPTGISIKDAVGSGMNISSGKVAFGSSVVELLQELVTLLQQMQTAAPTFVSTAVGPGVLNPTVTTALTTIITKLNSIKGSL